MVNRFILGLTILDINSKEGDDIWRVDGSSYVYNKAWQLEAVLYNTILNTNPQHSEDYFKRKQISLFAFV